MNDSAFGSRQIMMRHAPKKKKSDMAGNLVGGTGALATAYFTGGNPTATMAAFNAGKSLTDGVLEGDSSKTASGLTGGVEATKLAKSAVKAV